MQKHSAISRINKNNNIHIIFIRNQGFNSPRSTGIKTRVLTRLDTALKPGF